MINQNDIILLLAQLQKDGVDTSAEMAKVMASNAIPLSTLKFINSNRQLEVSEFYALIRKNYNQKKSQLYKNIMKEQLSADEVLTTLAALLLQLNLFANKTKNKALFLKWCRADAISQALATYYETNDMSVPRRLLQIIKSDIKTFEALK